MTSTSRRSLIHGLAAAATFAAAPIAAAQCVTFDPPPPPGPFPCCGTVFTANGVDFRTQPFEWSSGVMTAGGEATIVPSCNGGPGFSLWPNNVNLELRLSDFFGTPDLRKITFRYMDFGGNINLSVNGVMANFENYHFIPAAHFAGAGVMITTTAAWTGSAWVGDVTLTAMPDACITQLSTGGQELCLDDFCADPCVLAPPCPGDLDGDGIVGFGDLVAVLSAWGPCPGCPEDLDGNNVVGFSDVVAVLSAWGPC